jgi:hypothetical protein
MFILFPFDESDGRCERLEDGKDRMLAAMLVRVVKVASRFQFIIYAPHSRT